MLYELADFFDQYVQWFAIRWLYAWEFPCLYIIAVLLLLCSRSRLTIWAFYALSIFTLIYLFGFDMHLYSLLAYPLIVGTVGYCLTRRHWQRVVAFRLPDVTQGDRLVESPVVLSVLLWGLFAAVAVAVGLFLPKSSLLACLALFAVAGVLAWNLAWRRGGREKTADVAEPRTSIRRPAIITASIAVILALLLPSSSLLMLIVALLLVVLLLSLLAWSRGGERLLARYIAREPRMGRYFDCVRRLRASAPSSAGETLLAKHRLDRSPLVLESGLDKLLRARFSFWSWVFWWGCLPVVRHVLRFVSDHRAMPVFDSKFVTDCLEHVREKTWSEYQRLRYGGSLDNYEKTVNGRSPLPAELNAGETSNERKPWRWGNARNVRLKWLAQTEALAECSFFSNPAGTDNDSARPNLLRAAGLLTGGAELQHELASDLALYRDGREARELRLARHFIDLSARCLELLLDPGYGQGADDEDVTTRVERFCGALADESWWEEANRLALEQDTAGDSASEWEAAGQEYHVRLALLWQYLLAVQLEVQSTMCVGEAAGTQMAPEHPLLSWLDDRGHKLVEAVLGHMQEYGLPHEPKTAVAHMCACASFLINDEWGGEGGAIISQLVPSTREDEDYVDPLAMFGALLEEVESTTDGRRIWRLRGRLHEQQMSKKSKGSQTWGTQRSRAAAFYCNAHCLRVWRLHVTAPRIEPEKRDDPVSKEL